MLCFATFQCNILQVFLLNLLDFLFFVYFFLTDQFWLFFNSLNPVLIFCNATSYTSSYSIFYLYFLLFYNFFLKGQLSFFFSLICFINFSIVYCDSCQANLRGVFSFHLLLFLLIRPVFILLSQVLFQLRLMQPLSYRLILFLMPLLRRVSYSCPF